MNDNGNNDKIDADNINDNTFKYLHMVENISFLKFVIIQNIYYVVVVLLL